MWVWRAALRKLMSELLDDVALENSWVVANCLMNRERGCIGGNSYANELRFDPLAFLQARLKANGQASWLDLCCGSGKALIETAQFFEERQLTNGLQMIGIDLVEAFWPDAQRFPFVDLQTANLAFWQPQQSFDLITCVHGLHYIGDKLNLIQHACTWLKEDGFFLANLDLANLRFADGSLAGKVIAKALRMSGLQFDTHHHLLTAQGRKQLVLNYVYCGADAEAGPNYTGQAAINSFYQSY